MDWNNDGYHDLLVGDGIGNVSVFMNTEDNINPILGSGSFVLNTGDLRGTPVVYDWNGDGNKDLLVGNLTGTIQIYLNEGADEAPLFSTSTLLQVGGSVFDVGSRSAPRIYDWNHDGVNDILVGEVYGNIFYLENAGTNSAPVFNSSERLLLENGAPLKFDLGGNAGPRSRFFVTDWNEDGLDDIIVGGSNGKLELYTSVVPEPVSSTLFLIGGATLGFRYFRNKLRQ